MILIKLKSVEMAANLVANKDVKNAFATDVGMMFYNAKVLGDFCPKCGWPVKD
jgi:hypothetical protein